MIKSLTRAPVDGGNPNINQPKQPSLVIQVSPLPAVPDAEKSWVCLGLAASILQRAVLLMLV